MKQLCRFRGGKDSLASRRTVSAAATLCEISIRGIIKADLSVVVVGVVGRAR